MQPKSVKNEFVERFAKCLWSHQEWKWYCTRFCFIDYTERTYFRWIDNRCSAKRPLAQNVHLGCPQPPISVTMNSELRNKDLFSLFSKNPKNQSWLSWSESTESRPEIMRSVNKCSRLVTMEFIKCFWAKTLNFIYIYNPRTIHENLNQSLFKL